jgi:hypothetical protein
VIIIPCRFRHRDVAAVDAVHKAAQVTIDVLFVFVVLGMGTKNPHEPCSLKSAGGQCAASLRSEKPDQTRR